MRPAIYVDIDVTKIRGVLIGSEDWRGIDVGSFTFDDSENPKYFQYTSELFHRVTGPIRALQAVSELLS